MPIIGILINFIGLVRLLDFSTIQVDIRYVDEMRFNGNVMVKRRKQEDFIMTSWGFLNIVQESLRTFR